MQKLSYQELTNMTNDLIGAYNTADPDFGNSRALGAISQLLILLMETPSESSAELTADYIRERTVQLMTADV